MQFYTLFYTVLRNENIKLQVAVYFCKLNVSKFIKVDFLWVFITTIFFPSPQFFRPVAVTNITFSPLSVHKVQLDFIIYHCNDALDIKGTDGVTSV